MDCIDDLPPSIQNRLPQGPDLTNWLLTELNRARAAAVRGHVLECEIICPGPEATMAWLTMMRTFVLQHRAGPTYVTNVLEPTGPDVRDGWHCQECGLDRDGPIDEWPCQALVMFATSLWYMRRPHLPVAWAWTASADRLIWVREGVEGPDIGRHTTASGNSAVGTEFTTYQGDNSDDDALGEPDGAARSRGRRRWSWLGAIGS